MGNERTMVGRILEVGCNRGHNLRALRHLGYDARGVEPQSYARRIAQRQALDVRAGSAYTIPYPAESFDLVFTCGVLIHVPPDRLQEAMRNLAAASGRYILAVEYETAGDTEEVVYRGLGAMLWKRDYGAQYLASVPGLEFVATGEAPAGFERASYWLFEKSSSERSG